MNYKHKKTGKIAVPMSGTESKTLNYGVEQEAFRYEHIPSWAIEDSQDWQPINPVLLVTEDEKTITNEDDQVFGLYIDKFIRVNLSASAHAAVFNEANKAGIPIRFFSTSAARDEYVLLNKPGMSAKDVLALLPHLSYAEKEQVKQLAKTKL